MLDTNVCIDFALARNDLVRDHVQTAFAKGLAISAVTLAELRVGARHKNADPKDEKLLDKLIQLITIHPFDAAEANTYGALARRIGFERRSYDRLIAAHALTLGLTLVTNNERDFADVPGLRVENWAK